MLISKIKTAKVLTNKKGHTSTDESDGSDITNVAINDQFKNGLFVAMSTDGTFQFYKWEDIAGKELLLAPNGVKK